LTNHRSFFIFVTLVLLTYGSVNFYIFRRVTGGAHLTGGWGFALKATLLFLILAYPISRFPIPKVFDVPLSWIGALYLGAMVYAFLGCLLIDLARVTDLFFGWFPTRVNIDLIRAGRITTAAMAGVIVLVIAAGHMISLRPVVRTLELRVPKLPAERDGYRVVLFADTHLGTLVGRDRVEKVVQIVNSLKPDAVLIAGDLLDEPPRRVEWVVEPLRRLQASNGVWAALGNHEFYSGPDASADLMRRCGMNVMRDGVATIPGIANIAGLDDIAGIRQFGQRKVPVAEIMQSADPSLPTMIIHHTPLRYEEADSAGVDLMVCGHSHGGQMWPFNYIADRVYGVPRGYTRIGNMHFYMTVGAGTWGPPIRIAATPEVILFILKP